MIWSFNEWFDWAQQLKNFLAIRIEVEEKLRTQASEESLKKYFIDKIIKFWRILNLTEKFKVEILTWKCKTKFEPRNTSLVNNYFMTWNSHKSAFESALKAQRKVQTQVHQKRIKSTPKVNRKVRQERIKKALRSASRSNKKILQNWESSKNLQRNIQKFGVEKITQKLANPNEKYFKPLFEWSLQTHTEETAEKYLIAFRAKTKVE